MRQPAPYKTIFIRFRLFFEICTFNPLVDIYVDNWK